MFSLQCILDCRLITIRQQDVEIHTHGFFIMANLSFSTIIEIPQAHPPASFQMSSTTVSL